MAHEHEKQNGTIHDSLVAVAQRYSDAPTFREAIIYALNTERHVFVSRGGFDYLDAKMKEAATAVENAKNAAGVAA